MKIRNKCVKCKFKWKDYPGAFAVYTDGRGACCPVCKSKYFKWSSYESDLKKYPNSFDPDKY